MAACSSGSALKQLSQQIAQVPHHVPNRSKPNKDQFAQEFLRKQTTGKTVQPRNADELGKLDSFAFQPPQTSDWSAQFESARFEQPTEFSPHFEEAFQKAQAMRNWQSEYQEFIPMNKLSITDPEEELMFQKAFEQAKQVVQSEQSWTQEYQSTKDWAQEFNEINAVDEKEALRKTAAQIAQLQETSEKFTNSQFFEFIKDIRDDKVRIEGNDFVPCTTVDAALDSREAAKDWAQQFGANIGSWEEEFESQGWINALNQSANKDQTSKQDWVNEYQTTSLEYEAGAFDNHMISTTFDQDFKAMKDVWESSSNQPFNHLNEYKFIENNPYVNQTSTQSHRNLAESILALEASVQLNPDDWEAWYQLGIKQQENENEIASICALRQSVVLNPTNLNSWLALAVSYTNEGMFDDAYDSLEKWMLNSTEYSSLIQSVPVSMTKHERISAAYLKAVRMNPFNANADIQCGLGVLFNISGEYEKAVDCFKSALAQRPNDYMLWNKLGATLANSSQTEKAFDAYFQALQINPTYLRSIYNLAISCIQMEQYTEAAHHLVSALLLQKQNIQQIKDKFSQEFGDSGAIVGMRKALEGISSDSLWNALRMVVGGYLNRHDLTRFIDSKDLEPLKHLSN